MKKPSLFQKGITYLLIVALSYSTFGCASYTSPFVYKTEEELEAMEGVNATANRHFQANNFTAAQNTLNGLCSEQTVSRPLYQMELLSTLLLQGKKDEAHELMKKIHYDLEVLFDRVTEEKASSFWHGEQNKVFKGDNHERAIFYALFAMSFIERGEYEDALRCVKNGLLADASTEDEAWSSDFGLLHYLGYIAARHAKDTASEEEYKREYLNTLKRQGRTVDIEGNSWAALVDETPLPNAFMVVWSGEPPTFHRGGTHHEIRYIVPGKDELTLLTIEAPEAQPVAAPRGLGDVNFQATTRGGREMDDVLANKALLKSGMEASRNILLVLGTASFVAAAAQSDANVQGILYIVGGVSFALGIGFHVVGALVNSEADIRAWRNLPANFFIVPLHLPEGEQEVTLHGYYNWDEILTEKCRISTQPERTVTQHYSIMPSRNQIRAPMQRYRQNRVNDSSDFITNKHWMDYEIIK